MITLDRRAGSGDLIKYMPHGVAALGALNYGDACFLGEGPEERPVSVGVEVKTIPDALKCITDGRFAGHQLPGLVNSYEVVYLVVEGLFRPGREGVLEVMKGQWVPASVGPQTFMYRDLDSWLTTMEMKVNIKVRRTSGRRETGQLILDLYRWWSKGWDSHRSHLSFHTPPMSEVSMKKPSLTRRIAKELPGIGWERSKSVEDYFGCALNMMMAEEEDWMEIEGIGPITAERVVEEISGGKK